MKDRSPDVAAGAVIPTAFEMGRGGGRGMGGGGGMGGRRGRGLTFGMGPGKGGGRGMGRGGTGTGANSGMFSAFPPASMSQQTEGRLQPLQNGSIE